MEPFFHRRYLTLVDEIEQRFPVVRWRRDDLEVWPLARMELYLDMYWANADRPRPEPRPFPFRSLARIARPLRNVWRSRHDLAHFVARPKPAYAMFLGDGVSLDFVDGSWRDRFCEPLIDALEKRGSTSFLMQSGDLSRLPWYRPTFAANLVAGRGYQPNASGTIPIELPGREDVVEFLERNGVHSASLDRDHLVRTANVVAATATEFERVIRIVRPTLAFVVTYYANLGHAFLLACRRRGILSIDLQHCAQEGAHKAYGWSAVPKTGYASLPAIFWNWSQTDAAAIREWTSRLERPWHRSLHGGHTQLAPFLGNSDSSAAAWDGKFEGVGAGAIFEREILIALQPISGHRAQWEALAEQIKTAPASWRWWIRRHPASSPLQDVEYAGLLSLRMANVVLEQASLLPLPALLRHMSILVSLASGSAAEAAEFGVPAIFLLDAARGPFAGLMDKGLAEVVQVSAIAGVIARTPKVPARPPPNRAPDFNATLDELNRIAGGYRELCASRE
ncbi:MAG TPA: hypothetical protein VE058_02805 [Steroidobacteraceae bacterium]|nr:hypothetical protein [Steroidobacteraceae bacterium]